MGGWHSEDTTGALIRRRLDACRACPLKDTPGDATAAGKTFHVPVPGTIGTADLSLPVLTLLLVAPELVGRAGIAFGLLAAAVGMTWVAARLTRAGRA